MEKTIYKRLLEAQKKIGAIKKGKVNPFYKSKYADINAYIEDVKPILNECGLIILQPLTIREGKMALKTTIIDSETGEEIKSVTIIPEGADAQKQGAVITYFRRYAIQSLLFLQAEDDDANSASQVEKVGNKTVVGNSEVPDCSICGNPMKPTKPGSKVKFYCKHENNQWGKPVLKDKPLPPKEQEFSDSLDETIDEEDLANINANIK